MHEIKCECFVISSCPLIQIIQTYTHSHTYFSCFVAHHSALFIGECLLAFWLKLESAGLLVPNLTFTVDIFKSLFSLPLNSPLFLQCSIIYQGSLFVSTMYNSLGCHCHALSCIFLCSDTFFVLVLLIITNFLYLILKKEINIKVVYIVFFFFMLSIFLLELLHTCFFPLYIFRPSLQWS